MTTPPAAASGAWPRWTPWSRDPAFRTRRPGPEVVEFHRTLDNYAPTPLAELPGLAREAGVRRVVAKCESTRLGLPAFKALGASWAIHRALAERDAARPAGANRDAAEPATLVTATDGNHGRAVAHFARLWGHGAEIYVPQTVSAAAIDAIKGEGATVHVVSAGYDDTVAAAADAGRAGPDRLLVQDTSWEGYRDIPQWIVDGYSTLFREIDDQLRAESGPIGMTGMAPPDLVLVPTGVGSLLQAALTHYGAEAGHTRVVAVEPSAAAAVPPSLAAGEPVTVPTGETRMAGLNCGTLSALAWPVIEGGLDGAAVVSDEQAISAAQDLAENDVDAGACGAASLAGLRVIAASDGARDHLRLGRDSTVVLLITEGTATNPLP